MRKLIEDLGHVGGQFPVDSAEIKTIVAAIRLATAAQNVLETFEKDEAQGYRSKDRQYAIALLNQALREYTAPKIAPQKRLS